jgi:hypothetical protein
VSDTLNDTIAGVIEFLPQIIAALLILVVGFVIGRVLGDIVTRIVRKIGVDRYAEGTAIQDMSDGDAIARILGKLVAYYVYFVAIFAAVNVVDIEAVTELLRGLAG